MIRVGGDDKSRLPLMVEPVRQPMDNIQAFGISIYEREVEPLSFFERTMADNVFSPKEAEPAPITVIFVGRVMELLRIVCKLEDAEIINPPRLDSTVYSLGC